MPARLAGFLLALSLATAGPLRAETVTVFAAASLKTALDAVAERFTRSTGHEIRAAYAGSSVLARQIQAGAPADIFISANPDWMDVLENEGRIDPATRRALLGNRLVLISAGTGAAPVEIGPGTDLAARLAGGRLAMGLVDAVPVGIYGQAALQSLGLWAGVADQVAQTDNARAALALVASGAAPLGVVYATDAAASTKVRVLGVFPADSHPPIIYPVAAIAGQATGAARAFLDHLISDAATGIFRDAGFVVPVEAAE